MNSAAFVSTWATWALLLGAAGAVMLRTGRCGARTATSRSPPPVGAREHPELHSADPPTFMLTFVWIIAISVSLLRRGEHTDAVAVRAEPATA